MYRIKRAISILTAAVLTLSAANALAAGRTSASGGKITAAEVEEMFKDSSLLINQDYCNDILNTWICSENPISETYPYDMEYLKDRVNPETTYVSTEYDGLGSLDCYNLIYIDENNNYEVGFIDVLNGELQSYFEDYVEEGAAFGTSFPTMYLDFGYTAKLINDNNISGVTGIRFTQYFLVAVETADGEYILNEEGNVTTMEERDRKRKEKIAESRARYEDFLKQKRALTPPDLLAELEKEYVAPETSNSLEQYKNQPPVFSDLGGDEQLEEATALLKDKGIISGYGDGTFRPEGTLTRAEAAVCISALVKGDYNAVTFPDMRSHWANGTVSRLAGAGVINGYEDGLFRPDEKLTYEQIASLIYSVMGYTAYDYTAEVLAPNGTIVGYRTNSRIGEPRLAFLMRHSFFNGLQSFADTDYVSRGDFVKILANAFDEHINVECINLDGDYVPSFGVREDVTLADYLDGSEITNGFYSLSRAGYDEYENAYSERFYEMYNDILPEEYRR